MVDEGVEEGRKGGERRKFEKFNEMRKYML